MAAMLSGCENYNAPYSSSSTCSSYQKDKQAIPGNLPKGNALSKIEEQRIDKYSNLFFFTWCVICGVGNGNRKHYGNCV